MSEDDGSTPSSPPDSDSGKDDTSPLGISRRTLLVGAAGIGVGSVLGVGYAVLGGSDANQSQTVEPAEPDDDGTATLGELHYILENSGTENARLDVTEFIYFPDDASVKVSYRSRTDEVEDVPPQRQHVREVGQMVRMYAEYVAQNGNKADVIHAHIMNPSGSANQPDGYLVRREWVKKYNSGEWSANGTLNKVLGTGYTDETLENASDSTTSSTTTTSE